MSAALLVLPRAAGAQPSSRGPDCREWHECRQLALDALSRGEYERFHDLAWRAVQTGPPRDPALMYLLARAQSLSGRAHDALVMLDRLADMGVATDAATNDEFHVVRTLREWPELDVKLRARTAPKATEAAAPVAPDAPAAPDAPVAPNVSVVRVPGVPFTPHGLAYDAVSSRFVVADPDTRKLVILDERSNRAIDLVRASSAGFGDLDAFDIDARRGDLWVLSGASTDADAATLHKLQLVSGRPLGGFGVPASFAPVRFVDVAVTPAGAVLMLDAAGGRIFSLDPATHEVALAAAFGLERATSLAPADDRTLYLAYGDGVARVDLVSRSVTKLQHTGRETLGGFTRIRWSRGALVGVRARADGSYGVVEVRLRNHHANVTPLGDTTVADPTAVTIDGGDLFVLARDGLSDLVVRRIHLR